MDSITRGRRCTRVWLPLAFATLLATGGAADRNPRAAEFAWWDQLRMQDLSGAQTTVVGQIVVLAFLDPECPVANKYLPVLNALARGYRDKGVSVIGVYADPAFAAEELRRHGIEFSIAFPVVQDREHRLVQLSGVTYSSEVAVLDGHGTVLYHGRIDNRVGEGGKTRTQATQHDLQEVLDRLLAGEVGPFPTQPGFGCFLPTAAVAR